MQSVPSRHHIRRFPPFLPSRIHHIAITWRHIPCLRSPARPSWFMRQSPVTACFSFGTNMEHNCESFKKWAFSAGGTHCQSDQAPSRNDRPRSAEILKVSWPSPFHCAHAKRADRLFDWVYHVALASLRITVLESRVAGRRRLWRYGSKNSTKVPHCTSLLAADTSPACATSRPSSTLTTNSR